MDALYKSVLEKEMDRKCFTKVWLRKKKGGVIKKWARSLIVMGV